MCVNNFTQLIASIKIQFAHKKKEYVKVYNEIRKFKKKNVAKIFCYFRH